MEEGHRLKLLFLLKNRYKGVFTKRLMAFDPVRCRFIISEPDNPGFARRSVKRGRSAAVGEFGGIGLYIYIGGRSAWPGWLGLGGDSKPTFLVSSNSTSQQSRRALIGRL